jgi:uncharacterized protein
MPIPMIPANSLLVDTSGWADPVLGNTPDHEAMEALYKETVASGRPLVTTNYILAELLALLSSRSRATRPQILSLIRGIKQLPQLRIIHVSEAIEEAAWNMLEQYDDKDWSLVDAARFVLMQEYGICEAFTSDHHFTQAGLARLP